VKQGIRRDLKDFHGGGIPDYSRLFPTILWSGFGQIYRHGGICAFGACGSMYALREASTYDVLPWPQ
jgi:hypothetical protein